jgi:hypothetical protein
LALNAAIVVKLGQTNPGRRARAPVIFSSIVSSVISSLPRAASNHAKILRHGRADVRDFGRSLARLRHRRRVDRLDDFDAGRHDLAHAEGDAAWVDQQRGGRRQRRERGRRLRVGHDDDAVGGERRLQPVFNLAVSDKEPCAARVEQHVRDEHRVMADVGAAQVGEPRDVVQCRDEVMGGTGLAHFLAHRRQLGGARCARVRSNVLEDRRNRQRGAIRPHLGQDIQVGAQPDAFGGQCGFQRATGGKGKDVAINADGVARLQCAGEPVHMSKAARTRNLHQVDAGAGQLYLGLGPVTAVDPQASGVARHNQRADRAGESAEPLPSLPPFRQVL